MENRIRPVWIAIILISGILIWLNINNDRTSRMAHVEG